MITLESVQSFIKRLSKYAGLNVVTLIKHRNINIEKKNNHKIYESKDIFVQDILFRNVICLLAQTWCVKDKISFPQRWKIVHQESRNTPPCSWYPPADI